MLLTLYGPAMRILPKPPAASPWLQRLGLVGAMFVVGILSGTLVVWVTEPVELAAWWNGDVPRLPIDLSQTPWEGMFYGVLYATTM